MFYQSDPDLEDDPGELVEIIAEELIRGDRPQQSKVQLREAIVKLIDERIAHALFLHRLHTTQPN